MDVKYLKHYLSNNTDKLVYLLEQLEFANIKVTAKELRCARAEGHNPTSIKIDLNNMLYHDFRKGFGGDIINLLQNERDFSFLQALNEAVSILNLDGAVVEVDEVEQQKVSKLDNTEQTVEKVKVYTKEEFMKEFDFVQDGSYIRFLKDEISLDAQDKFELMYDDIFHRIIIPWRDKDGRFVGYSGRYNGDAVADGVPKYYTMTGFSKGSFLYGIYENYECLCNSDKNIWVFEAEKSVMQAYTVGIYNCVAVGSNKISDKQMELLKGLNPKSVMIAFDKGLEESQILKQAQKLKDKGLNVRYLFDADNKYLKRGSKDSPMDLRRDKFKEFARDKTKLKWF